MSEYNYPFSELIGILTINQIKEALLPQDENLTQDIQKISVDIDSIIRDKDVQISSRLIRAIICLSQMDLHIWHLKDEMARLEVGSLPWHERHMKAHQINGIRNRMKNIISESVGEPVRHNNDSQDSLDWHLSI